MVRPLVIAHRGHPGYLPEHSYAGYAFAHAAGADLIEVDVVLSRDEQLVCLHDLHLASTTDVADLFPDRARDDGRFHASDLTRDDLHQLTIRGRTGDPIAGFRIPTLDGVIETLTRLNNGAARSVGLIVEPKLPDLPHHRQHEIELRLAERLERFSTQGARAVLQTFDRDALERVHTRHPDLERVFLTDTVPDDATLRRIAEIAHGLGPERSLLDRGSLLQRSRDLAIPLYPWTFGDDDVGVQGAAALGVAGVFTDFPDQALRALGRTSPPHPPPPPSPPGVQR